MSTSDRSSDRSSSISFQTQAPPPPQKKRPAWVYWLMGPLLVLVVVGGIAGYLIFTFLQTPADPKGNDVEIVIPQGSSFADLTQQLIHKKAITDGYKFTLLAHWMDLAGKVKTGRFLVNTGWKPIQVLEQLTSGKPLLEKITIPEGLTWWEIGKRLESAGFVHFEDFKKVVHDPKFLRHWGIPFASAEGFLFPDTYLIMRPIELNETSAKSLAGRLVDTFWRRTMSSWPDSQRPGPDDAALVRRTMTLASIVEKETSVSEERSRVAGVYSNRLRKAMLLQADPTIIYGIGPDFSGDIRRSDLDNAANPYNTYKHGGLPPGPICSPGLACIKAALAPEEHNYIFFVARGDGSHSFSITLDEHNRAVRMYRSTLRKGDNPTLMPGGNPG